MARPRSTALVPPLALLSVRANSVHISTPTRGVEEPRIVEERGGYLSVRLVLGARLEQGRVPLQPATVGHLWRRGRWRRWHRDGRRVKGARLDLCREGLERTECIGRVGSEDGGEHIGQMRIHGDTLLVGPLQEGDGLGLVRHRAGAKRPSKQRGRVNSSMQLWDTNQI